MVTVIHIRKHLPSTIILPSKIRPKPTLPPAGSNLNFAPVLPANTLPKHYILHLTSPIFPSKILERGHIQIVILFSILISIMYELNYKMCIVSFIIHTTVIIKRWKTKWYLVRLFYSYVHELEFSTISVKSVY